MSVWKEVVVRTARVSGFLSASTTECLWDIEERAAIGQTEANDLLGVWKLASDARGALWADVKFYCAEVLSACDFDHGCTSGATSDSRLSFCAAGYVAWRVCCEGLHCWQAPGISVACFSLPVFGRSWRPHCRIPLRNALARHSCQEAREPPFLCSWSLCLWWAANSARCNNLQTAVKNFAHY